MSDTQKQAIQKFGAGLIAVIIAYVMATLQSPDFGAFIGSIFGGDNLFTGIILAAVPPLVLYLGKLAAGATVKAPLVGGETRGAKRERVATGEQPGLFG